MFEHLFRRASTLHRVMMATVLFLLLCFAGPIRMTTPDGIPVTLQSLAVILIPVLIGWRWGLGLVLGYLLCGGMGLPVFAGGTGGWAKFGGTTAGFLLAFPMAAVLTGALAERITNFHSLLGGALVLLGQVVILVLGLAWSANISPTPMDWQMAATNLAPGLLIKSGIGAFLIAIVARILRSAGKLEP